jgi:hypothetical protein
MTLHFRFVAQRSARSCAAPRRLTQGSRESPLRNIDEEVGGKAHFRFILQGSDLAAAQDPAASAGGAGLVDNEGDQR